MDELDIFDINSLNAIAGLLRCLGADKAADTLWKIQTKVDYAIKAKDALLSNCVDKIYDMLDEFDMADIQDLRYIKLIDTWFKANADGITDEAVLKDRLKQVLKEA